MAKKNNNPMTIEDLAEIIQRTMASKEDIAQLRTETKDDLHRLEQKMDTGFFGVNRRIDLLREDLSDLPDIREEVKDLVQRMERVEQKVGLAK